MVGQLRTIVMGIITIVMGGKRVVKFRMTSDGEQQWWALTRERRWLVSGGDGLQTENDSGGRKMENDSGGIHDSGGLQM